MSRHCVNASQPEPRCLAAIARCQGSAHVLFADSNTESSLQSRKDLVVDFDFADPDSTVKAPQRE